MDPNKTLEDIREILATEDDYVQRAGELATLVQALDEWLTSGGFLPEAWTPGPRSA